MLSRRQLQDYQECGHVTVPDFLSPTELSTVIGDLESWSDDTLAALTEEESRWFTESTSGRKVLRKLDNPVYHRPAFRKVAESQTVVECVEQLIGADVCVFFSQVFCKAPEVGGPKPVHQDNFYFGPSDLDGMVTVWIALDHATVHNGCLFYGDGSHRSGIYQHEAPEAEPFNLQIVGDDLRDFVMTAAPVPAGGVSFHHGNTWHQSSANKSDKPRRAVAMHYLRRDVSLTNPALAYDSSVKVDTPR